MAAVSTIHLPRRSRGRQNARQMDLFQQELAAFARQILQINSTLDIRVSSRGWCYLLEPRGLNKGDFNRAQTLINDCRKSGMLPIEICAEDSGRECDNLEILDGYTPEEYAQAVINGTPDCADRYDPQSFWENQSCYCEMLVEKIDLKSLFAAICAEHHIPLANASGWNDINTRAAIKRRFAHWEARGSGCVLLYCGDHDPAGLRISDSLRSNLDDIEAIPWSTEDLVIDRFGLNFDFIEEQGLTWIDGLYTGSGENLADPNHGHHNHADVQDYIRKYGARKCEANALVTRPEAGRQLCLDAVQRYVDLEAKVQFEEETQEARERVRKLLQEFIDRR